MPPALSLPPQTLAPSTGTPQGRCPLVTIAIPAYNRPWLLRQALQSIERQTARTELEVVVCDDLDLEETRRICAEFEHLPCLYLPNVRRLGAVANWNRCLAAASGRWVMVLHEDDTLYPWYLQTVLTHLEDDALAVCTKTSRGEAPPPVRTPTGRRPAHAYRPGYFLKSSMSPFPGVLVRRAAALRLGGFDDAWGPVADYEFWYRLACAGPVKVVDCVGAFYRVAPGQWTERAWVRMLELSHLLRLKIAREQFPEAPAAGRWAARLFTAGNAKCYARRFGRGPAVLDRCLRLRSGWGAWVPSGWVWKALKFASQRPPAHFLGDASPTRASQIQQAS